MGKTDRFRILPTRFTLIELLAVISVIIMLMSLLLPALQKAKESATRISCLGNMKQLGVAMLSYTSDYNEYFTPHSAKSIPGDTGTTMWIRQLAPYVGFDIATVPNRHAKKTLFLCPADNQPRDSSYVSDNGIPFTYCISGGGNIQDVNGKGITWYESGWASPCKSAKISQMKGPGQTFLISEVMYSDHYWPNTADTFIVRIHVINVYTGELINPTLNPHPGLVRNYLFCDGSAKGLRPADTIKPNDLWTTDIND